MENHPLVIYHGGCRDGWASASIAHRRFGLDALYHPGFYGQPPPLEQAKGRQVFVLDFSYPRHEMKALILASRSTVVLDHHKTAEAALLGVLDELQQIDQRQPGDAIVFNMKRSGAGLTWDFFNPGKPRPWWVDYVEDRDLGRMFTGEGVLPDSRTVNAYLGAVPFSFKHWAALDEMNVVDVTRLGRAIEMKVEQYCAEVAKNAIRFDFHAGPLTFHEVPLVNAPQCDVSELLDYVLDTTQAQFAMAWWQRADKVFQYSLRSRGSFDVSGIAKALGGGGHMNAAGFQAGHAIHTSVT